MNATRALLLAATCLVPVLVTPASAQPQRGRAGTPAAAPRQGVGQGTVSGIDVVGNQRIEADTIRSYMLLQPGDRFDSEQLDRSLRTLFATGLFRDVQVGRQGDRVVVRVQENPIVNRVAFEGNRKISDDQLQPLVSIRPRAVFTPQAAQSDREKILELYARRGRFAATVEPKVIELPQNRVDVVFEIKENETALIGRINFVGNEAFSDSRLKEIVASREAAWYRPFSSSDSYDPDRLNFDRELLRRYYLRHGYADVQVTAATAELAPDRSGFFVTYTINEGKRYRVSKIEVTSQLRNIKPEQLRPEINLSRGDWYDGEAVENAVQAIQDRANELGAPFAEAQPRIQRDREKGTVEITFDVREGERLYVDRIDITGNTRTQDRVIRREFRVAEGDPFNAAQIRRSRQRVRDLGYFNDVNITTSPGSAPDRVIVNAGVSEKATGEISLGGGYSTDAGALADIGLRERNLLGTGIDARINGTIAQRRSSIDASVTDPSFLDRNLAVGADVFYVTRDLRDYSGYEERRYGFALRAGYEFNEFLRQSWTYTLSQRNIFDISNDVTSKYILEQKGKTLLSQLGQTLTWDKRDSRLDPSRGYVLRFGTDFAGIGGDAKYVRWRGDGAVYVPFEKLLGDPKYVLAISGSVGYLQTWGGGKDLIVDRFFLGGENLRGFEVAGVGPRDRSIVSGVQNDESLGGRFLWTQSTEFRFPLPIPDELGITGRTFVDVGALSQSDKGDGVLSDSSPRVGAGAGISWASPFGLINLDFAAPVVKKSYDQTQVFRFGFGTRF
ncbi:Outer membrane protein assembly factor yaeT [Roseomonas mucosa]|uniref:Outer membrane protein assembly factor BamA n=1 Tax=Roseomonas mucosa TaxID=207340 RepID=A0A4Y1N139_9PROT|nr:MULTISPECIES: outer membrane protein assembly factor BamA [Roseomonas]ATR20086.1 outer membrane protein assembly factor BamA [Roseomonas sp. FDAARGOS_362]AWV23463.1 Outer membrane protein assembly factor yaeT [Roseomonas mucosa]MDT8275103.1 outer membrane protein assembly factor BamA [Roseomonas mucosa]MDT8353134.1 outer membrane protein assembly factor BamA [Roseomonas mucosa]MDU7523382.1 outer membrane protein assembly factor BamA [Roseomonas mucosa]